MKLGLWHSSWDISWVWTHKNKQNSYSTSVLIFFAPYIIIPPCSQHVYCGFQSDSVSLAPPYLFANKHYPTFLIGCAKSISCAQQGISRHQKPNHTVLLKIFFRYKNTLSFSETLGVIQNHGGFHYTVVFSKHLRDLIIMQTTRGHKIDTSKEAIRRR